MQDFLTPSQTSDSLSLEIRSLRKENQNLQNQIQALKKQYLDLDLSRSSQISQMDDLRNTVLELVNENSWINNAIQNLEQDVQTVKKDLKTHKKKTHERNSTLPNVFIPPDSLPQKSPNYTSKLISPTHQRTNTFDDQLLTKPNNERSMTEPDKHEEKRTQPSSAIKRMQDLKKKINSVFDNTSKGKNDTNSESKLIEWDILTADFTQDNTTQIVVNNNQEMQTGQSTQYYKGLQEFDKRFSNRGGQYSIPYMNIPEATANQFFKVTSANFRDGDDRHHKAIKDKVSEINKLIDQISPSKKEVQNKTSATKENLKKLSRSLNKLDASGRSKNISPSRDASSYNQNLKSGQITNPNDDDDTYNISSNNLLARLNEEDEENQTTHREEANTQADHEQGKVIYTSDKSPMSFNHTQELDLDGKQQEQQSAFKKAPQRMGTADFNQETGELIGKLGSDTAPRKNEQDNQEQNEIDVNDAETNLHTEEEEEEEKNEKNQQKQRHESSQEEAQKKKPNAVENERGNEQNQVQFSQNETENQDALSYSQQQQEIGESPDDQRLKEQQIEMVKHELQRQLSPKSQNQQQYQQPLHLVNDPTLSRPKIRPPHVSQDQQQQQITQQDQTVDYKVDVPQGTELHRYSQSVRRTPHEDSEFQYVTQAMQEPLNQSMDRGRQPQGKFKNPEIEKNLNSLKQNMEDILNLTSSSSPQKSQKKHDFKEFQVHQDGISQDPKEALSTKKSQSVRADAQPLQNRGMDNIQTDMNQQFNRQNKSSYLLMRSETLDQNNALELQRQYEVLNRSWSVNQGGGQESNAQTQGSSTPKSVKKLSLSKRDKRKRSKSAGKGLQQQFNRDDSD